MFSLFTTIEMPSFATWTGKLATPFSAQSASSSSLIGREAFDTSVSPRQKRSNPPPVPDVPTVIFTPGSALRKRSAARLMSGATVLEPSSGEPAAERFLLEGAERILAFRRRVRSERLVGRALPSAAGEREGEQQETGDGERAHRKDSRSARGRDVVTVWCRSGERP